MNVSIITINLNNVSGLERTLDSVARISSEGFEHIVIDGQSTDGSVELLKNYSQHSVNWISESDSGIYEAMNKGIRMASGGYLLFLNSGDTLLSRNIIENFEDYFRTKADIFYGDLIYRSDTFEKPFEYPVKLSFQFVYEYSLPHPGSFIKRDLFDQLGYYNEKNKYVSDWEFFMNALFLRGVTYKHLNEIISVFHLDGFSNDPKIKKKMAEERAEVMNRLFPNLVEDLTKLIADSTLLETNRFKILKELEASGVAKKLNSVWLRLLLRLFKGKSIRQLNK